MCNSKEPKYSSKGVSEEISYKISEETDNLSDTPISGEYIDSVNGEIIHYHAVLDSSAKLCLHPIQKNNSSPNV